MGSVNTCAAIEVDRLAQIIVLLISLALASVHLAAAAAQQPKKVPRIAFLTPSSLSSQSSRLDAFCKGLRKLGYVEGKNIVIEYRYAEGLDRLPAFAAELVRLKIDTISLRGAPPIPPPKAATATHPS